MSNPVASICEVFVHGSTNKERSPISVAKVSLELPFLFCAFAYAHTSSPH
jgi:hypothetical protein